MNHKHIVLEVVDELVNIRERKVSKTLVEQVALRNLKTRIPSKYHSIIPQMISISIEFMDKAEKKCRELDKKAIDDTFSQKG